MQMADQPVPPQPARAPKRQRKNRESQRKRPQDQGAEEEGERYPEAERTLMVQAVLKALTPREAVLVRIKGDFPNERNKLNKAYAEARRQVHLYRNLASEAREHVTQQQGADAMEAEEEDMPDLAESEDEGSDDDMAVDAGAGGDAADGDAADAADAPDVEAAMQDHLNAQWLASVANLDTDGEQAQALDPEAEPTHNAIKVAAKKWTKRFLRLGHVHDLPPSQKNAKLTKYADQLAQVYQKILRGWRDVDGRVHAYFGLDDLERRDRRAFTADRQKPLAEQVLAGMKAYHELKAEMDVKFNRYMWGHLKAKYPHLRRLKHRVRRMRKDRDGVMVCSAID